VERPHAKQRRPILNLQGCNAFRNVFLVILVRDRLLRVFIISVKYIDIIRYILPMQRLLHPMCELCVHYRKSVRSNSLSKCGKFTYMDLRWDTEDYEYADYARRTESKCGKEGRFYRRDDRRDFTKDD